eukprot:3060255-Amphidinium_carterae.1
MLDRHRIGSAFVGGVLSDSEDYRFTFRITAVVYFTACMCYLPLLVLVPRKESESVRVPALRGAEVRNATHQTPPPFKESFNDYWEMNLRFAMVSLKSKLQILVFSQQVQAVPWRLP